MELIHLRSFVAVAEEQNLTRAARMLSTTPPSVSAHIKSLEDELNVQLFVRTPRGMTLTPAGTTLLKPAEATLSSIQRVKDAAIEISGTPSGKVTLALNTSPELLKVAELSQAVKQQLPKLNLVILNSGTGRIIEEIKHGIVDLGFVFGPIKDPMLTARHLGEIDAVALAPKAWSAKVKGKGWKELSDLPWIESAYYCPLQEALYQTLGHNSVNQAHVGSNDEHTKFELVRNGIGLAMVEHHEALQAIKEGGLTLCDAPPIKSTLAIAWSTTRNQDKTITAVTSLIESLR